MDTKQEADMGVTKESFGFLEDKREAFLYTIENQNGFAVKVTDFGVNIVSLLVKNKEGNIKDVALGYDTLEEYFENGIMFGATVGRNVNRISNARFEIDGKEYHVAKNRGKHNIHSDKEHGFHKVLWDSEIIAPFVAATITANGICFWSLSMLIPPPSFFVILPECLSCDGKQ